MNPFQRVASCCCSYLLHSPLLLSLIWSSFLSLNLLENKTLSLYYIWFLFYLKSFPFMLYHQWHQMTRIGPSPRSACATSSCSIILSHFIPFHLILFHPTYLILSHIMSSSINSHLISHKNNNMNRNDKNGIEWDGMKECRYITV